MKSIKSVIGTFELSMNVSKLDQHYENLNFLTNDTIREVNRKISMFFQQDGLDSLINPGQIIQQPVKSVFGASAHYIRKSQTVGQF